MSKNTQNDASGVPVVVAPDDSVHPFPDGVPVAVSREDVPEGDSGSKSGQKAATQKKES